MTSSAPALRREGVVVAVVIAAAWALALLTFSWSGRRGPESLGGLDVIAAVKVAVRVAALAAFAVALWRLRGDAATRASIRLFAPLAAFVAWALFSAVWSPLPLVSLGQAFSLLVQIALAVVVARLCDGEERARTFVLHVTVMLLVVSGVLLVVEAAWPGASGFARREFTIAGHGLHHPTTAAATAAVGLILAAAARASLRWPWTEVLLVPAITVHGLMLFTANSRAASAIAVAVLSVLLLTRVSRRVVVGTVAAAAFAGLLVLFSSHAHRPLPAVSATTSYVKRGESVQTMTTLTGRTALWRALAGSVKERPLVGHGYFVTSRTGRVDVWREPANLTAHNALLQVLVSTGLVGLALFVWGLGRPLVAGIRARGRGVLDRRLAMLLIPVAAWYAVWSQVNDSYAGPLQPETIAFFVLLGVVAGLGRARQ